MEITLQKKTVRQKAGESHPGIQISCQYPQFFENGLVCQIPNEAIANIIENLIVSLFGYAKTKTNLLCVRPLQAEIFPRISRSDTRLLAAELVVRVTHQKALLLEKRFYLYFTKNGNLPLCAAQLIGRPCKAVTVKQNTATDIQSGKTYPLKKKYCIDTDIIS